MFQELMQLKAHEDHKKKTERQDKDDIIFTFHTAIWKYLPKVARR